MSAVRAIKRFVVAEESMAPALRPGDGLLAVPLWRPRVGQVVVAPHPSRDSMWLVKRIAAVGPSDLAVEGTAWTLGVGEVFLLSDDTRVTRADSRTFGPVEVAGAYRVVLRVPARWLVRRR